MSATAPLGLPEKASLEQLKKQAKELVSSGRERTLAQAQHTLAQGYGFASWPKLKLQLELKRLRGLIRRGELAPIAAMLKASPRLAQTQFPEGDWPLHVAAEENRPELVELLVRTGAQLESQYADSAHSALSWALTTWSFAAAEKLVELGVRPDLFCAAGLGRLDLVQAFWPDRKLVQSPSRTGSSRFNSDWSERLPCPPESDGDQLGDALYIACRADRLEVAEWLLERGADPNFRGYLGATCLAWAEFSENPELCARLRAHSGSDELRDYAFQATSRQFPIMVLAGWGFGDRLAQRLARYPEEAKTSTPIGGPLHAAARDGHLDAAKALLGVGADRSLRNAEGRTAADVAETRGHTELAELLR